MEFCLNPPVDWVGPMIKSRFKRIGGRKRLESDESVVNPDWRPFSCTVPKRERKLATETMSDFSSRLPYGPGIGGSGLRCLRQLLSTRDG